MTTRAHSHAYPPRCMRRDEAASYVRVSPGKFDQLVADGRMPKPARIDGCVLWDRYQLDAAVNALFDQEEARNPFDGVTV